MADLLKVDVAEATALTFAGMGVKTIKVPPKDGGNNRARDLLLMQGGPIGVQVDGGPVIILSDREQLRFLNGYEEVTFYNARSGETGAADRKIRALAIFQDEQFHPLAEPPQPDVMQAVADISIAANSLAPYSTLLVPNPAFLKYEVYAPTANAGPLRVSSYTQGAGTTDRASIGRGALLFPGGRLEFPGHMGLQLYNENGSACSIALLVHRLRILPLLAV